jgi:hypothetical protein
MRRRFAALAALLALGAPAGLAAQTTAPQHAPAPPQKPPAHPAPGGSRPPARPPGSGSGYQPPSYGGYYPSVTIDSSTMHQLLATPAPQHTAKPRPTAKPAFTPQVFGTHSTSEGQ